MTTYTGPTPYDANILALENALRTGAPPTGMLGTLYGQRDGYHRGYADAKAEAAPLLEALKAADEWSVNLHNHDAEEMCPNDCVAQQVLAAIAQAEGKETP